MVSLFINSHLYGSCHPITGELWRFCTHLICTWRDKRYMRLLTAHQVGLHHGSRVYSSSPLQGVLNIPLASYCQFGV